MKKIIIIILLLIFIHCNKNPTSSDNDSNNEENPPRWKIDTLAYPGSYQTLMSDIYATSPENVYVVGHNSQGVGVMWHYNGSEWEDVKLNISQGGSIVRTIGLDGGIIGFSEDDIWAVGRKCFQGPDSSLIIHYDGKEWSEAPIKRQLDLTSIGGDSPDNIWCGGIQQSLYHYDGNSWKSDSIDHPFPPLEVLITYDIESHPTAGTYLIAYTRRVNMYSGICYLCKYNDQEKRWMVFDSPNYISYFSDLWFSPSGILYSDFGECLCVWNEESWSIHANSMSTGGFIWDIFGVDDNDFYYLANGISDSLHDYCGKVFHFDGTEWKAIEGLTYPDIEYTAGWSDGEYLFVVAWIKDNNTDKSIVVHGKCPE